MPRPQFGLRTTFWLTLAVAAFCAGITFERERRQRADQAAAEREELRRGAANAVVIAREAQALLEKKLAEGALPRHARFLGGVSLPEPAQDK